MIDVTHETLIRFRDLPSWSKENLGTRIHPSTFQRWRLRGVRGIKLLTILTGGTRCTSVEALNRFFAATTAAADGQSVTSYVTADVRQNVAAEAAAAYLTSQGI